MNSRQKFTAALASTNTGRPPIWVMRQAGRYLPEYRKLKEEHGFLKMVKTPELSAEVTLQPLKRFNLDAAILFSDILVIPEAMGQTYEFREGGGINMQYSLESEDCVKKLETDKICESLSYVKNSLQLLRARLPSNALIGFSGSPWTLACYMIEGGSKEGFPRAVDWATNHPRRFNALMEKLTLSVTEYLKMQSNCGIDAVQIFDSWQNLCPKEFSWEWSLKWIKQIVENLESSVQVILYAKSSSDRLELLRKTGVNGLSISQEADLKEIRKVLPKGFPIQGNLDPELLETNPAMVKGEVLKFLQKMNCDNAHILNLGHGIRPQAKIECMEALVETVTKWSVH